jgi:hypothetical protein
MVTYWKLGRDLSMARTHDPLKGWKVNTLNVCHLSPLFLQPFKLGEFKSILDLEYTVF